MPCICYTVVSFMRTKLIATIGPSSESPEVLRKLAEAGLDIARMNFSHCTYEEFEIRRKHIRSIGKKLKRDIKILQDLQGPRVRVGALPQEGRKLTDGENLLLSTEKNERNGAIFIDNPYLHLEIKKGEPIYLSNGEMELIVHSVKGHRIHTEVVRGGVLYSHKSVNVPRTKLRISGLTKKDLRDLSFGLKQGVDYVAISFVQSPDDIEKARKYIKGKAKIIAKIETALALEHIDEIIQASDGIMIARGDLGIEVAGETLPFIQKNLIRHAIWHHKPSITATQILTSMIDHPHPTRAEVSDIANAVFDGTDAIMLSDETASGKYPIRSLRMAAKVVREAEKSMNRLNNL